jgi:CheY-like chemotaxis protein
MATVLLVEDVEIVRMVLRKFLECAGHVVTECSGGDEARRLVGACRFDVVVTDLWMKQGNGVEFIRDQSASGDAPRIIAMTGGEPKAPGSRSVEAARAAGAGRVLTKPVTKTDILTAIDAVLRQAA